MSSDDASKDKEEHLRLSGLIKGVHSSLRQKYQKSGNFEEVWQSHCQDELMLAEYADAMHRLAETIWAKNPETRIDWCRATCLQYFYKGGLQNILEKEERRQYYEAQRCNVDPQAFRGSGVDRGGANGVHLKATGDGVQGTAQLQDMLRNLELPKDDCRRPSEFGVMTTTSDAHTDDKLDGISDVAAGEPALDMLEQPCSSHVSLDLPSSLSLPQGEPCHNCLQHGENPLQPCRSRACRNPHDGLARCQQFVANQEEFLPQHQVAKDDQDGGSMEEAAMEDDGPVEYSQSQYSVISLPFQGKIRLLDVGSCFNPFLRFEEFLALGIDISPAVESVYKCDFLHLQTTEPLQLASDTIDTFLHNLPTHIERLPRASFHTVVFSLLLEYFPSPYQRWLCCQKAHELLMLNGLLLVITPDSSHQNKNAHMIRSWRTAIESLGFIRWRYVKLEHLHCMAFRKVALPVSDLVGDTSPDMMYIPQDFSGSGSDDALFPDMPRSEDEDTMLRDNFMELPDV